MGGAPKRSLQRERVCESGGSSLRGANDQLRFTGSLVGPIPLICQRTRASDRLSAKLLCGRVRGRQAAHRRVIDAPSSSPDQQGVKLVERSHRRQSGAAQTAPGEVGAAADEAPRRERKRSKVRTDFRLAADLTLPVPSEGANVPAIGCSVFTVNKELNSPTLPMCLAVASNFWSSSVTRGTVHPLRCSDAPTLCC